MTDRRCDPPRAGVPGPEEPADDLERARARSLAKRVDALVEGQSVPPVVTADERALLEAAVAIRAAAGELGGDADRTERAIDGAFAQFGGGEGPVLQAPRRRVTGAALPWMVAAAAASLALVFALGRQAPPEIRAHAPPVEWTSRPADGLVGAIDRARAADARERADAIFADRLRGYRDLAWPARRGAGP